MNGHSRRNTIKRMKEAQRLLQGAHIFRGDWKDFLSEVKPTEEDLVYLDPPYDVPQSVHFENIDHDDFLWTCKSLLGFIMISGYSTPRYEEALVGWNRASRERSSVGKGVASRGSSGTKPRVEEVIWWRDPKPAPDFFESLFL